MANVPTDEPEAEYIEPVTTTAIRDAILARIPEEDHIIRDVRIHDGIADISLRWRTLRFSTSMAFQQMTPADIADKVEGDFKAWVGSTVKTMNDTHRHALSIQEMAHWLRDNPPEQPIPERSNKTTMEAA